jgi:serine/threonine protein kinase
LEAFIQDLDPRSQYEYTWDLRISSLKTFIGCLSGAVRYIHSKITKHMDIKPKNILVCDLRHTSVLRDETFKVYIADFGISRSHDMLDAAETEDPTRFTRKHAAPEIVDQSKRGLSADIFSLGCVFVEIGTTLNSFPVDSTSTISRYQRATLALDGDHDPLRRLEGFLRENEYGDTSYQASIDAVCKFVRKTWFLLGDGDISKTIQAQILAMLSEDPLNQPAIDSLAYSIKPVNNVV